MPRVIAAVALGLIAVMAALYLSGADRVVQVWALDGQREAQTAMARGLRALRAGDLATLGGFLAVCFAYGFFHAAGPGHGKLLIGGYGAARSVGAVKLSAVALASSLAQGVSAVALVGFGLWVWQLGREEMTALADRSLAPLSFAAIALVGLWLVWRGLRSLIRARRADAAHTHGHDHGSGPCTICGHAHGPDPERLAQATGWRDIAVLIGAVAIRPCTGALFVLILTAQMGIFAIGIAGTFAMALGTASITVAVALAAVTLRKGVLAGLTDSAVMVRVQPVLEIVIGAVIAVLATQLALAAL
jgi:ABC-type nickel/cobalt efflux system permease component RcnA